MPVEPTRSSLLSRLRDASDAASWREFEATYRDLIVRFCRARGLQFADAEDVAQVVLASLARSLPGFQYDRERGRFRDYLFRCIRGVIHRRRPGNAPVGLLPGDEDAPPAAQATELDQWEREWMDHHYRRAVGSLRETPAEARSLEILERSLAGATPRQIAEEMGMELEAVYKARQRVRGQLEAIIARQIAEEDAG